MCFLKNTLERFGYSGHIKYLDTLKISHMFPTIIIIKVLLQSI